jgi:cytolysin-activating lysine-acyltransferase
MLGEMTWLLQQSPLHRHFSIADLEWMIMPPLMLEQYRIFRGNPNPPKEGEDAAPGTTPMGLALWAMLSEEAEQKLNAMVMGGQGPVRLRPDEWRSGDRLWLIDLIAPFATAENKLAQVMLADLLQNGLKHVLPKADGNVLKLHKADPKTGKREVVEVGG